jgi:hypothetical protein
MNLTIPHPHLKRYQWLALIVGLAGLVISVGGAFFNPEQFWQSYLLAYIFWLQFGLGCLALVMLHHLVGGRWSFVIRRLMEAGAMTLPLLAGLFIPLLLGLTRLYSWANPEYMAHHELLQHKSIYLNIPFFLIRAALYLIVWGGLAYWLHRLSLKQDQTNDANLTLPMRRLSGVGIIIYMLTATFAAYDWLMSLEPEWFSSIYGLVFMVGQALAALALAIIGLSLLAKRQATSSDWVGYFNDLGNFLLGLVMIWAYVSFSQFLVIWSANLPDEVAWYYHRSQGGWQWLGMLLIAFHFVLPFLLLLSQLVKRKMQLLAIVASLVIGARLADLYWLIMPAFYPNQLHIHWLDLTLIIAIGGGWLALFFRQVAGKPLLPLVDPQFQEVITHAHSEALIPR